MENPRLQYRRRTLSASLAANEPVVFVCLACTVLFVLGLVGAETIGGYVQEARPAITAARNPVQVERAELDFMDNVMGECWKGAWAGLVLWIAQLVGGRVLGRHWGKEIYAAAVLCGAGAGILHFGVRFCCERMLPSYIEPVDWAATIALGVIVGLVLSIRPQRDEIHCSRPVRVERDYQRCNE